MAKVYEYNSEKIVLQVLYNFEMQNSLLPCSELNKEFKTDKLSHVCCAIR